MHGNVSWKQSFLTIGWCWLMVSAVATALAQSQGRLRLSDLPPAAHVYVDAKSVVVQNSLLALPSGWHQVQVEKQDSSGLQVYRRLVQIIADKTADMRVVWHPVQLTIGVDGLSNYSPRGVSGPSGEPGPPARPYKPLPINADPAVLRSSLQEARDILVSDFEGQVQDALNGLSPLAVPVYLYVPGPPFAQPPGDPGQVGPAGQPGIPAEVRLIQAPTGVPLRDRIEQRLGLSEMQQTLSALQARLQSLSHTPHFYIPLTPETVNVLTPAWKTALDEEWKKRKAKVPEPFRGENFGIIGLPGAPGRRGPDGIVPADAVPVRVSQEQEKQLLEILTTDTVTRARIAQLRQQLTELTRRVYLAEGIYLEQFPPSPSPPAPTSFLGLAGDGTLVDGLWEGPTDYRVALRPIGRVRAVMLFAHFPDTMQEETTADLYNRLVPEGIAFFQRASYGKMKLEVDAVQRWIPMDHPTTWPGYDCSKFETHKGYLQEVITKAAEMVRFQGYDIVYVVGSLGSGLPNSPTFGAPPGQGIQIQGQEIRHAVTFGRDCRSDRWGWQTLAHETGHICGLPDLYRFGAPAKPYKGIHIYVGSWDLMGFQAPGSEYLAWQKRKLEWLTDQDFAIIKRNRGSQEVWITPINKKIDEKTDRSSRKAVVVPISSTDAYVAEVRRRDDLPDTGVLLYRVSLKTASGHGPIQIIPAAPDDEDPLKERRYITLYNALYHDGLVLDDPKNQTRIEIVGRKEGAIRVRVTRKEE